MRKHIIGGLTLLLTAAAPMVAKAVTADCSSDSTALGLTLSTAAPGDVIEVDGLCTEGGEIRVDDLTIQDIDGNATVAGELGVNGAQRVTIQNLRIDGSPGHGIVVSNGGSLSANNLIIENCEAEGAAGVILVHNSSAVLNDVTIRNASYGVAVGDSGHVAVANALIEQIALNGVDVFNGAAATLDHVTVRRANTGVAAYGNAYVEIQNGSLIEESSGTGVLLHRGADGLLSNSTIKNNGGSGIVVHTNCSAIGDNLTVIGNTEIGIEIGAGSNGDFSNSTIQDNGSEGVDVSRNSSVILQNNFIEGELEAIFVGNDGEGRLVGNTISATSSQGIALDILRGGAVSMRGGNTLTSDGFAIFVREGATFHQRSGDDVNGRVHIEALSSAEFNDVNVTGNVEVVDHALLKIRNQGSATSVSVTGNISLSRDSGVNFYKDAGEQRVRVIGNITCADKESSLSAPPSNVMITGSTNCTGYNN